MLLDVREPARDRPTPLTLGDPISEKRLSLRSEMKKEDQLDAENSSSHRMDNGWNIPSCADGESADTPLSGLMSRLSLGQQKPGDGTTSGRGAVRRLLEVALAGEDVQTLRRALAEGSPSQVAEHLRRSILEKFALDGEKQNKDCSSEDAPEKGAAQSGERPAEEKPKKKRDAIAELKHEDDLCPRSPMRLQHSHRNSFPYQNTSRKLHSGGYLSTVVYSDPVAPTPAYHQHLDASYFAGSPPLGQVAETPDVPTEMSSGIDGISDLDQQLLMDIVEKYLMPTNQESSVENNETDLIPVPISELNSIQVNGTMSIFEHVDHLVPTNSPVEQSIIDELLSSPSNADSASVAWGDYSDESTSGCCSLSPNSVLSSSPGGNHLPASPDSGHVVPDISGEISRLAPPIMSPSGHFFDDNCPYKTSYNIDIDIGTKDTGSFKDVCNISPMGYPSISTPSPTMSPTLQPLNNVHGDMHQDFDLKLQNASNSISCSSHDVFDDGDLFLKLQDESCSESNDFSRTYTELSSATTDNHGPAYTANISMPTHASENMNQTNAFRFDDHSTVDSVQNILQQNANFNCGSSLAENVNNIEFYDPPTFVSSVNAATGRLPSQLAPNLTACGATYVDSTPSTVHASNVQVGVLLPVMQARLLTSSGSNLKQLKPKVEHSLRMETGKERILRMMDRDKKAQAWVKVSANLKTMNTKDEDGDTQLMILCTNTKRGDSCVLEYTYALVEMLKKTPNALSAVNNQNQSALYLAALYSNYTHRAVVVRYIAETLIELGQDINYTSESGSSILHEICQQGDQRYDVLVELLSLKNKAGQSYFNVNKYNHEGKTALHLAASCHGANGVSCLKTVRLLIAEGADITLPETSLSNTVLHLAVFQSCAPSLVEALLCGPAARNAHVCTMINSNKDSPLHAAASRNDVPLDQQMRAIKLLLKHGAVKSLNTGGKYPIALVAEERRQEIKRVYEMRKGSSQVSFGSVCAH